MSVRISNYPANGHFISPLYGAGTLARAGSTFTAPINCTLASVSFILYRIGSMTGNATATLYAITGTPGSNAVPTGSAIATSGNLDVSTITTSTNGAQYALTFSRPPSLTAGTTYALIFNPPSGSGSAYLAIDNGNATASENAIYYSSSAWGADTGFVFAMAVDANASAPVADFTANTTLINTNDSINFTDASTNTLSGFTAYSYDFGDGDTSTDENPTHQYTSPGTYTVALTATTDGASNSKTRTNYITVIEPRTVSGFSQITGVSQIDIA